MNKLNLQVLLFALLFPFIINAQGWEKTYDGGFNEQVKASDQTLDGGIILAGVQEGDTTGFEYPFLYKIDADGNLLWEHYDSTYGGPNADVYDVFSTSDGNYLMSSSWHIGSGNVIHPIFQKISADGTSLWNLTIPLDSVNIGRVAKISETATGDYLIIGRLSDVTSNGFGVTKIDSDGNIIWTTTYESGWNITSPDNIKIADNGEILVLATIFENNENNILVQKLSSEGSLLWEKTFTPNQYSTAGDLIEMDNGEFIIASGTAPDFGLNAISLIKIDADGNELWSQYHINNESRTPVNLLKTNDGNLVIAGDALKFNPNPFSDYFLMKVDTMGNEIWYHTYGRSKNDYSSGVIILDDLSFYLTGYTQNFDDTYDGYVVKTDSLGNSLTNQLHGNLYYDLNEDCIYDSGEGLLEQWLVKATKGNVEYYDLTDQSGNYEFTLDSGDYIITTFPTTPYWDVCNNNFEVSFQGVFDTLVENIGAQAMIECPLLDVSIGTPFLRRCFENTYTIQYCNYGTIDAIDAYVEIEFDTAMQIINSSIPIAAQVDNMFTFELGDVAWGQCGNFTVDIMLGDTSDCDAIPLGTTHCVEAHIYPDSICLPSGNWSGASVEVDAACSGDSISFFIQNVGSATTQPNLGYIVVEDDVILFDGDFTLDPMEFEVVKIATNGATFRLEAEQEPNHPGMNMPSVTVEGCAVDNTSTTLGFLNIFSQNDGDPFVDIDCRQNVGAYDPNDKTGFPLGHGSNNYIDRGQDLEYLIRFQNTGTDTAFNIVILDTLSEFLDLTTVRPGASSHPYQFDISNDRALKFSFNNIMLPDSFINEPASNGFVKFKVAQQANLDLETQILNSAAIYFDFNPPIITNETLHTIGETFFTVSIHSPHLNSSTTVKAYPNPFNQLVHFELKDWNGKEGNIKLFDTLGKLVQEKQFTNNTFTINGKNLEQGIYFFTIEEDGHLIASGKLIAN